MSSSGYCARCRGTGEAKRPAWVLYPLGQTRRSQLGVPAVFKLQKRYAMCVEPDCEMFRYRFGDPGPKRGPRITIVTGMDAEEIAAAIKGP